jgi:HEAT repeat protein
VSRTLDQALAVLLRPSGDAGAARARGEALGELLERADEAHPRLLELAQSDDPPLLALMALPRFGRPESVPVLERVLRHAPGPTTVVAAGALSEHPDAAARSALEEALSDQRVQVVLSAVLGLAERGETEACGPLQAARSHPDAEVRERVDAALLKLGCGSG